MLPKDVLFYSNYCLFSKKLLTDIQKLNLKDNFILICVEHYKSAIPATIDRVPTIVTTERDILCEDMIHAYIETVANSARASREDAAGAQGRGGGPSKATANHHAPDNMFSMTAAGFSYLEEGLGGDADGGESGSIGSAMYGLFGQDQRIETPTDDGDPSNDSVVSYERYKATRDADSVIGKPVA
jgi:hypothetical protein